MHVAAGTEVAAGTGDHDRADFAVTRLLQRGGQALVHLGVEGVEDVRAVERDREDCALTTRLDGCHRADFRRSTQPERPLLAWPCAHVHLVDSE